MQKQLDMSSTEADKLLKKAGKMNDQLFNGGGAVTKIIRESRETIEEPEKTISDRDRATMQGLMSLEERDNIRDPFDDTGMTADQLNKIFFPKRAATRKMPAEPARGMKGGGSVASEEYYAHGGAAKKQKRGKSNKHGAFSKGPGQGAMVKGTNFRGIF